MSQDAFIAPACSESVEILYEDDDILLINKPSGLLSLSGRNPRNRDSLHYRLVNGQKGVSPAFREAKLPHRLDFGTSGVMVVALHAQAASHLNKQFQKRAVAKTYVAILEGWVADDRGVIEAAIAKSEKRFEPVRICTINGKQAISEYRVLERLDNPRRTLVEFKPRTGRTHQLRIHSWFLGHPILGCDLYKNARSERMAKRLQLHARDLFFEHPSTGQTMHGHSAFQE